MRVQKYMRGARYVGFYLDRMHSEIKKMAKDVDEGVYWDVLWQYREETYNKNTWLSSIEHNITHRLLWIREDLGDAAGH